MLLFAMISMPFTRYAERADYYFRRCRYLPPLLDISALIFAAAIMPCLRRFFVADYAATSIFSAGDAFPPYYYAISLAATTPAATLRRRFQPPLFRRRAPPPLSLICR